MRQTTRNIIGTARYDRLVKLVRDRIEGLERENARLRGETLLPVTGEGSVTLPAVFRQAGEGFPDVYPPLTLNDTHRMVDLGDACQRVRWQLGPDSLNDNLEVHKDREADIITIRSSKWLHLLPEACNCVRIRIEDD